MSDITYYSKEGLQKLEDELKHLRSVERPEISKQIEEARDKGDLSENAEYDAAKDAQGMLEMKIAKLEDVLANARVLDSTNMDNTKVYLLSTVEVLNHNSNKTFKYTIVNEQESDHKTGKISVKSPIGNALIGKSVGDVVDIEVPAGTIKLEILDISRL